MEQFINKVIQGDCLEELKTLEDNSVDSIVTDPPYELGFMGKSWDNTGIANNVEMWKECLRVLKPGGHLLAFSGTRTYHRMASAIEDAGFEVRDMIEWVYGSGFPKSHNIGKAVDKLQGNEREEYLKPIAYPDSDTWGTPNSNSKGNDIGFETQGTGSRKDMDGKGNQIKTKGSSPYEGWGTALKPAHEPICMARKPLAEKTVAENCLKYGTGGINIDESRVESKPRLTGTLNKGEEIKAEPTSFKGSGTRKLQTGYDEKMAESNLGRFPANLIHDNSEEVRECFPETKSGKMGKQHKRHTDGSPNGIYGKFDINHELGETYGDSGNASRFFKSIKKPYVYSGKEYEVEGFVKNCKPQAPSNYNDEGSPARYFKSIIYQAKASKSERNKGCEGLDEKEEVYPGINTFDKSGNRLRADGSVIPPLKSKNNHPTVKPIALMEYLIKMVTPKGGIVLDPFAGSGSTLVAAKQNGYQYIGIELTEEYIPIINARLT